MLQGGDSDTGSGDRGVNCDGDSGGIAGDGGYDDGFIDGDSGSGDRGIMVTVVVVVVLLMW